MRTFFLTTTLSLGFFFLIAPFAFAEFVPLAPIPNLDTTDGATLSDYLNSVFNFAISIGAILAVLMIVKGGFEYMTTEAVGQKGAARTSIQNAVLGLILLLMIVLILEVINPQLLNLDLFRNLENANTTPRDTGGDINDPTSNPVPSNRGVNPNNLPWNPPDLSGNR